MRYQALDGWRGVCAVLVALHHFHISSHVYHLPFLQNGYLFVDFFFVLSGFVISHSWAGRITGAAEFRRFMARRFARVWPLHVTVLAVFVAMEAGKALALGQTSLTAENPPFSGDTSAPAILTNLTLLHSLGFHDGATWNYPSWSISTEFYTYAVFGLLCLLGVGGRPGHLAAVALAGAVVVALFSPEWLHTIADFGFFRCVYGFFIGAAVYWLVARHRRRLPAGTMAEGAVVVLVVALVSASPKGAALSMAAPLVFGAAVAVFAAEAGALSRLLLTPVPQALGTWSYSVYLLHSLVLVIIGRAVNLAQRLTGVSLTEPIEINGEPRPLLVLGGPWLGDVALLAYVLAVAGLSALAWRRIERPGQAYFKRLGD